MELGEASGKAGRAEAAEKAVEALVEEVRAEKQELGAVEGARQRLAKDLEELVKMNGSEREMKLAKDLDEARTKVLELEGEARDAKAALVKAQVELGESSGVADRAAAAEQAVEEVRVQKRKVRALEEMVAKQAAEMKEFVEKNGTEREAVLVGELEVERARVLELQEQVGEAMDESLKAQEGGSRG